MNTYLDVGVLQVQAYLTRGHRLRGRARGSQQLAEVSRRYRSSVGDEAAELRDLLGDAPAGWTFNPDAGAVDGVVSLRYAGTPTDEERDEVAGRVLRRLREHWPGAQLHAVWGTGEVYVDAYRDEIGPKLARHEVTFAAPAADELPLARPCQLCEQDAAVGRPQVVEDSYELCPDCRRRGVHTSQAGPGGRAVLLEDLADDTNHLGTVFVDGNAVGSLFAGLAEPEQRDRLSRALPAAVGAALDAATRAVYRDGGPKREDQKRLVHVHGGDDLLVSLPADRVWRFVRELLGSFEQEMVTQVADLLDAAGSDPDTLAGRLARATGGSVTKLPSAAAGVVVGHYVTPMVTRVAAAQERLDRAKRAGAGRCSAVAWTDLTVDGPEPPPWRRAWPLAELAQADPHLAGLARLPQSARHAVARLVDPGRPAVSWCRVSAYLDRLDSDDPTRVALAPLHGEVREADDPAPGMDRLLDALTLARWW